MIVKFKLFEYISHYLSASKYNDFQLSNILNITENESDEIYTAIANYYRKNPKLSYLGSGSYGSAFSLADKVLKISTDKNEANNIEYLRKKNFRGIVTYYDIRKINLYLNDELYQDKKLYAIIMDRVYQLNEIELECYRILYKIGYINSKGWDLAFEYTLDYNDINETSALSFRKVNNISRAKDIINLIKTSRNFSDFRNSCIHKFGKSIGFDFASFHELKDSPEFEETFLRFYDDILNLLCDVIKYKLALYDSHEKNVGKDDKGHFKMIDLGFRTNHPPRKLKLKPIEIHIDLKKDEEEENEFKIFKSDDDGETFIFLNSAYDLDEAIEQINIELEDPQKKSIKINNRIFTDYFKDKTHFIIIDNIDYPEIFNKKVLINKDPNQLSLWKSEI